MYGMNLDGKVFTELVHEVLNMWIRVQDALPNDLDKVDILINATRRVVDCTHINNKFYTHQFKDEYWTEVKNNVTHWMLVPDLPEV